MRVYRVSYHKTFVIGVEYLWDSHRLRRINISYGFGFITFAWNV